MNRARVLLLILLTACSDSEIVVPELGSVRVTVASSGIDIDRDGVAVSVASTAVVVPANGEYEFNGVAVGTRTVRLTDASANCTSAEPLERSIQITREATAQVAYTLTCTKVPLGNDSLIAFVRGNDDQTFDLWLMNSDGTAETLLRESPGVSEFAPAWSRDGQYIFFVSGTVIGRVNRAGGGYVQIAGLSAYAPSISPNGQKIAFMIQESGVASFDIWVMNSDGTNPQPLTAEPGYEDYPSWSPDGSQIVFERNLVVWVMNADGTNAHQITPPEVIEGRSPSWSPDGSKIAFTRRGSSEPAHIYSIKPDGTGMMPLTSGPDNDGGASWSPDGSRIIFSSARGSGGIWIMRADGSDVRQLNAGIFVGDAAWSP